MSVLEICQAIQNWQWSTALRESILMFPLIEGLHLVGLAFIMGPVLMFDLRLAGALWTDQPVSKVAKVFVPFSLWGAALSFATGILLFCAEPVKCYDSGWFRIKVVMLAIAGGNALYFHFKTQTTWAAWDNLTIPPPAARRAGVVSIFLWSLVILAGRWTAYNL
jgi:hypothetical protein